MTISKRFISILLILLLGAQMLYTGWQEKPEEIELQVEQPILIWYTDSHIQNYIETAAEKFMARHQVEVQTELVSEIDYIETICKKSVAEKMVGPDLYVVPSSQLEKAALSGLTTKIDQEELLKTYSEKAIQAVTYKGEAVARPFYIDTCFLLYNRYYTEEVPTTIEEILNYAENFEGNEATGRVEKIFEWNVADVIDNYLFLGAYTDFGGPSGDDKDKVSMDLDQIAECMTYYQSLNSFFAIDADTVTSEAVIQDFIDGKTVYTIANVPMLSEVDKAIAKKKIPEYITDRTVVNEQGEEEIRTISFSPFYGVAPLPALTDELDTRGISVTNSVVVNPYSSNLDASKICARYLTEGRASQLYEETGKLSACNNLEEELPKELLTIYTAYESAAEVPKIMELSNIWLHLEMVLANIWKGADAAEELEKFAGLLAGQLD